MTAPTASTALTIVYDGDCPFCASYVAFARLKTLFQTVDLLNARDHPELVDHYAKQGYDIDRGMIVESDGQIYFGSDAMWAINTLVSPNPALKLMGGRTFLKWIYPVLRFGRNTTLRLLGRKPLNAAPQTARSSPQ